MSRTSPSEALERLAWTLNYHRRDPISINELSEKADLSWATTRKYVQLLEILGRIAPKISIEEEGVITSQVGDNLYDISEQKDIQLIIYLFTHAQIEGKPTSRLDIEEHADVLDHYEETVEELEDFGWIKCTEQTVQLTPEGVSIAGPAHSQIRNQNSNSSASERTSQANPALIPPTKVSRDASDSWSRVDDFDYTEKQRTEEKWDRGYRKNEFHKTDGLVA